ncbi:RHS repeat-associated core domain-containing protein [Aureispira anguillae]|uniref:RHS repeat-associated core domain-containing protein n=1 Tax=Aureispira anguillae TaxID=2864201 RepID=A0A916DND8_9BACT|nr:RHS repeat-associated core domain-containing protein [Aureispira anguillae]BDS09819.1 RHS repeat-associated core domain-containing protein [Aureispira anguillae]
MKTNVLLVFLLLGMQFVNAQHPYESALNPLKDVLPPSPTAAALGTYGEIPVSLHTGVPNVSVPLCVLSGKRLSVPISLTYHGGGNQVDAVSSWVGLGWSLNAGGVISRTVNGIADDEQFGYWNYAVPDDFLAQGISNPATQQEAYEANDYYNYLQGAVDGERDGQPDQFNFNINGYAGRFYIENTGDATNPLVARLVPHQDIKIELIKPGSKLEGFTLTTPDGIKYKFGGLDMTGVKCVEKSKNNSTISCGRNYNIPIITSWYLREIEAPNQTEVIQFVYESHLLTYEAGISQTISTVIDQYQNSSMPSPCPVGVQSNDCIRNLSVEGIHLKRIEALGGRVEFVSTGGRDDLLTGGVQLREVQQYGKDNGNAYLKKYVLNQDYSLSNSPGALSYRHKRLRLLGVQEIAANNNTSKPPHVFEYEQTALPPRLSKARDFWGYYNGKMNNTSLIPASLSTSPNFYQGGGDRYPDFTYAKAGVLQKITYPTGGHTLLEYEGHELSYDVPIPELIVQNAGAGVSYYQPTSPNEYSSTFTLNHAQDVTVTVNVSYRCGAPAAAVSYLRIDEKINGAWQPLTTSNPNINPSGTGNDGKGTLDFNSHPTDEINTPYTKTFELSLPAGEYRLTAAALNGTANNTSCSNDDALSIHVRYEQPTGNLIYNEAVGGLRVKKVTIHDGIDATKDMVKAYNYNQAANSARSSGVGIRPLKFQAKNTTYNFTGTSHATSNLITKCEQYTVIKYSESQIPLHGVSGAHIAYKEVTVLEGNNGQNGKTWNKFNIVKNTTANLAEDLSVPTTILDWQGGLLLEQVVYKKENGNFIKVQEQINDYEIASINGSNSMHTFYGTKVGKIANIYSLTSSGVYVACDNYNTNSANLPGYDLDASVTGTEIVADFFAFITGSPVPYSLFTNLYISQNPGNYVPHPCEGKGLGDYMINYPAFAGFVTVRYPIFSGWNKQTKSTLRQYDESGTNYIETVTNYEYDDVYTHLNSTKVTNSDGLTHITKTKYPTDYANYTGSSDLAAVAIHNLKQQHRHNIPLEQTKYIQKSGQSPALVGGMLTIFDTKPNGLVVPKTVFRSEISSPIANYTESSVAANAGFVYDPAIYTAYGEYLNHDDNGNILDFQKTADQLKSFAWGYDQQLPITAATNAHSSEIGYTSFEQGDETGWSISTASSRVAGKVGVSALQTNEEFPFGRVFTIEGQEKKYKFSAWVNTNDATHSYLVVRTCAAPNNATYPNPIVAPSYVQTGFTTTNGAWQLIEVEIDLAAIRQAAGLSNNQTLAIHAYLWNPYQKTIALDAVRFHPSDAFVQTYDYDQNTRQLIATDQVNRLHSSYHYDDFQRLSHVKDFEGNIIGTNSYHYKGAGSIENHVKTALVRVAGKTSLAALAGLPVDQLMESYQYIDGLGRPIQSVGKGQSPNQKDVVSFNEYDVYGRQMKTYLPFVNSNSNTGGFNPNPIQQTQTYYANEIAIESQTAYPFSETIFEASPLNRPKEQSSAGEGWQIGNNHTVRSFYGHNEAHEVLRLDALTTTAQYYAEKELLKQETLNTKGVKTVRFSDRLGRTILVQQELSPNTWINTYTLYNAFGNVQAVLTPLAIERIQQTGNYDYTNSIYKELVYSYTYDARQRLTSKKIPNSGIVYYVYDRLDRVVATQDANQRQLGQWTIQKYDQYNRPIVSALYHSNLTQTALQQYFDAQTKLYEDRAANAVGYTNTLPNLTANDPIQTIHYYDDYDFDRDGQVDATNSFIPAAGYANSYFDRTLNQATGSKVRVMDGSGRLLQQVNFYDARGRLIQVQSDNALNGKDNSFSAYDFVGNLTKTRYQHSTTNNNIQNEVLTEEFFHYDHTGRLLKVYHKVGNEDKILLKEQHYDELGRLIEKNLHSTNDGNNFLQSIDYHYNVKNWLVRINDLDQVTPASTGSTPSTTLLQKKLHEIVLKYNGQDATEGEVNTAIEIDDETVDLVNGIVIASQQLHTEVDLYGEAATNTKDEEVQIDFSDQTITESNIAASLEELETRLAQKLTENGLTNLTVMEVLLEDLKAEYRDRWLLLRSDSQNEDNEDLLKMNFAYDYGGNIHHLESKVESYAYRSIYDYSYDNLDRLVNADYTEFLESSTPMLPVYQRPNHFSVHNISYDLMGNITGLQRRGTLAVLGTSLTNGLMDDLSYSYANNQLLAVQDAASATTGFIDGASNSQEYAYDENGNVTQDDNKQIVIQYNHLNLPQQIQFTAANATINWIYDATGNKVQKQITNPNGLVTNKYYIGNVQYVNTEVEFIHHSEGRIIRNLIGTGKYGVPIYAYRYEYSLKDHLGNGRVFFSDMDKNGILEVAQNSNTNELLQQEHYYPFGMPIRGEWKFVQPQVGGVNLYQYNGIEMNDDFGLNWNMAFYRSYDASIGRFHQVDPAAEMYYTWGSYTMALNNPIKNSDPSGATVVIPNELQETHNGLYESSATYRAVYDQLHADDRVLEVSLLSPKEKGANGQYYAGNHSIDIDPKLSSDALTSAYTEEVAHAYQGITYGTANLSNDRSDIRKSTNNPDEIKTMLDKRHGEVQKKGVGGGAFIEVEAKLIQEQMRQEVVGSDAEFSVDESGTGGGPLKGWFNKNRKDRKTDQLINISSERQVNSFFSLQKSFANYYIYNSKDGKNHPYAKNKRATTPDALNSLTNVRK